MQLKKIMLFTVTSIFICNSYAGVNGVTHHSRANCINNESISWHLGHKHWFWVESNHNYHDQIKHDMSPGWQLTWRAANVHWKEGTGGWIVHAAHFMPDGHGGDHLVALETVDDCSIYDGWWDFGKNKGVTKHEK